MKLRVSSRGKQKTPFRHLLELFQARFFESDDAAPGGSFETNIYQVLGFLLTMGFVIAYFMLPTMSMIMNRSKPGELPWAIRGLQLFSPSYTFAMIGFATLFEWDMLFPNRRDFLILASFPIRLRDVFAAQFIALLKFLGLLIVAVNIFPALVMVLMSLDARNRANALRFIAADVCSIAGVSAFAFFFVAGAQGVLINVTTPRVFRRLSPWFQMCGMSLMILSILLAPLYIGLLRRAAENNHLWLWLFPPVWFNGFYDLFFPDTQGIFVALGIHALRMLATAIALFALTWALGFGRYYRRTLEAEDSAPLLRDTRVSRHLARSPEARSIFRFSGKILARSRKHQLFLVTYLSVGVAIAINFVFEIRKGEFVVSTEGARAFPFFIAFFVISGFRAVFQFPAELAANWLFRITESHWAEISRGVTRKRVLASGLLPTLLLLLPFEIWMWRAWQVSVHVLFQFAAGALLVEGIFWTFDKVPFTCSYFPGRTNLSILFLVYFYGYSHYSFDLANLEQRVEARVIYAMAFFAAAAVLLALSWRRQPAAGDVRFDATEPVIQTLDLT